ncbi:MAG: hypothetical protein L0Z50_25010 [Verrucomicrobiales bacterium]|nr:hypothetical protein [Verrucomicrobiales bacterium]
MVAFNVLNDIEPGSLLEDLSKKKLREVQRALAFIAYPISVVDGLYGPNTRNAFAEFKEDIGEGDPGVVSENSIEKLKVETARIDGLLNVSLANKEQVKDAIASVCKGMGIGLKTQIAYVLATTQWETAHTFEPVREAFWLSETWRRENLRYYPFYGRGYVQLTWKRNYEKYGEILDVGLVGNPDLAMGPTVALFVLVHGFKTGNFTGRKIEDYINAGSTDYRHARRCINDSDKWREIKRLAEDYESEI